MGLTEKARYAAYLETDTWKEIRATVIARDSFRCRVCNSPSDLRVHHRAYPKTYGTEPLSDLITLCESCHELFHHVSSVKRVHRPPVKKPNSPNDAVNAILQKAKGILQLHGINANGNMQRVAKAICRFTGERYPRKRSRTRNICFTIVKRFVGCNPTVTTPPIPETPTVKPVVYKLRKKGD